MNKALVIGLGMGQQYKKWLEDLKFTVISVDSNLDKKADYTNVESCLLSHSSFNIVYIGTPNYTHESIARQVAPYTEILVIEKPGLPNKDAWKQLVKDFPDTRIMMVKNNQYRLEVSGFQDLLKLSSEVTIVWSREKGIPQPIWFRQKDLAIGGVSKDLMPHLLSYFTRLTDFQTKDILITSKDNNQTGIDDFCEIVLVKNNIKWKFLADWQNNIKDQHYIEFIINNHQVRFELGDYITSFGGCPGYAYSTMLNEVIANFDNDNFWQNQLKQDLWIHEQTTL